MLVFGTRPEAIKMAPLIDILKSESDNFELLICVTGQHRYLLDQVLDLFNITPDIDLNIMKFSQNLSDVTCQIILEMGKIFLKHKPDIVLVHGDTTTAFATSLAAFYAGISVGHIEAGLRTNDITSPFPEEFNRQVITKLSHWHFAPTSIARNNLISEKIIESKITVTGNTVIDSLKWVLNRIITEPARLNGIISSLNNILSFDWRAERFILVTGHRRENFGIGFLHICEALRELAEFYVDIEFVYPVHLNPNVVQPVREILGGIANVHLIDPLDYETFIYLLKHCYFVMTDSGGIQEEAPSLGKPVLLMRDITERTEAVEAGTVLLVGANKKRIVDGVSRLLIDEEHYLRMSQSHNPYGDGNACVRILNVLRNI